MTTLIAALATAASASADDLTLQATRDTSLRSTCSSNCNLHTNPSLVVGESGEEWRALVEWDFSVIPAGSTINSAEIRFIQGCSGSSDLQVQIDRVTADWQSDVGWAGRPPYEPLPGGPYNAAGCSGMPSGILDYEDQNNALRDWVQDVVDGVVPNHGLQFRSSPVTSGAFQVYQSAESSQGPLMFIDYTPAASKPSIEIVSASFSTSTEYFRGEQFPLEVCFGGEPSSGWPEFQWSVSISKTPNLSNSFSIGQFAGPGAASCPTTQVSIPNSSVISPGLYYVLVSVIDNPDIVVVPPTPWISPVRLRIGTPADLDVDSVGFTGSEFAPGDTIPLAVVVENDGTESSAPFTASATLEPGGRPISDAMSRPAIAGLGSQSFTIDTQLPLDVSDGEYTICVEVSTAMDADSSNNSECAGTITVTSDCVGDIADELGNLDPDGGIDFGDFLALLGLVGPCPGSAPGCTGDIADDFGSPAPDGMVSFGDFLALIGLVGPCP